MVCPDLRSGKKNPEVRRAQLAKFTPHLDAGNPGIFSDLLRSDQMLKREQIAKSNGKLTYRFILSKTATVVPEFAVEDLPLGRSAALLPEFTVNDLPLGRTLFIMIMIF